MSFLDSGEARGPYRALFRQIWKEQAKRSMPTHHDAIPHLQVDLWYKKNSVCLKGSSSSQLKDWQVSKMEFYLSSRLQKNNKRFYSHHRGLLWAQV